MSIWFMNALFGRSLLTVTKAQDYFLKWAVLNANTQRPIYLFEPIIRISAKPRQHCSCQILIKMQQGQQYAQQEREIGRFSHDLH